MGLHWYSSDRSYWSLRLYSLATLQVLESFWKINVTDIESTLKQVVTHVLSEPGVTERELNARAKALKKLGSIFQVQALPPVPAIPRNSSMSGCLELSLLMRYMGRVARGGFNMAVRRG